MTRYPIYQVDAFTSELFKGNPAAVMPLKAWLPDGVLQALAAENNLSETAFLFLSQRLVKQTSIFAGSRQKSKFLFAVTLRWQAPGLFSTNWVGLQTGFACAPKAVRLACTSNPTVGWFWISQILRLPNNLHPASYLKLWRMRRLRFLRRQRHQLHAGVRKRSCGKSSTTRHAEN